MKNTLIYIKQDIEWYRYVGECRIELKNGVVYVYFTYPQRAATPGQICVLYDGEICMGGGPISDTGPNYEEMKLTTPKTFYE